MRVLMFLLLALVGSAQAATIGVEQPTDGTKYALLCERIESTLLIEQPDFVWDKMPTYRSDPKGARVEECPPSQGNWFEFKTEKLRNYHIYARLIRYDAEGNVLSNRKLNPYFYFHGPKKKANSPVVILSV